MVSKEELIRIHAILSQMRKWVEAAGLAPASYFEQYDRFGVTPVKVHFDKAHHMEAVKILGEALSRAAVSEGHLRNTLHVTSRDKIQI